MNNVQNILKLDKSNIEDAFSNNVLAADKVKLPLTSKQNAIIFCLQNGCCLVTGQESSGAWVAGRKGQFYFSGSLFWRLVNMGLIKQSTWEDNRFDYILTTLGKKVITREVDMGEII